MPQGMILHVGKPMQTSQMRLKNLIWVISLLGFAFLLLWFLHAIERELRLERHPSGRYRAHAIPVALSEMHHGRPHDFTAWKGLAYPFHDMREPLDDLLKKYADPSTQVGSEVYFWAADDRGLSDYVQLAFRLFGPSLASLSNFWFVLFAASLLLFTLGYYREPGFLLVPIFILVGYIAYAHACPFRDRIPLGDGTIWGEPIALYESRTFDALGLIAWFHLAVLAWRSSRPDIITCVTAIFQAMLLVFLYHARSSLGWMYLSLLTLTLAAMAPPLWRRARGACLDRSLSGPILVSSLLLMSLLGLHFYKQAFYHPRYFQDLGTRTFWHNALMGFGYHPDLRKSLDVGVDDAKIILLVLKRMKEENDPRLDPSWTHENIGRSLAAHTRFDWRPYEAASRDIYLRVWKTQPGAAFACYAWYKPCDIWRHTRTVGMHVGGEILQGRANTLIVALVGAIILLLSIGKGALRDRSGHGWIRANLFLCLWLLCFSLIPSMAFYAALPTLAAFYVALPLFVGLTILYVGVIVASRRMKTDVKSSAIVVVAAPEKDLRSAL